MYVHVDAKPESEHLPVRPSELWHLTHLHICVTDEHGKYLLVQHHNYHHPSALPSAPQWSTPFVPQQVLTDGREIETYGQLRSVFHDSFDPAAVHTQASTLGHRLGVSGIERTPYASAIELKESPSTPGVLKAYMSSFFRVSRESLKARRNIADPEGLKGVYFVPLEDAGPGTDQGPADLFLGRPPHSNVQLVRRDPVLRSRTEEWAFPASDLVLRLEFDGVVAVVDLSQSARLQADALPMEGAGWLEQSNPSRTIRSRMARFLGQFATEVGARHISFAGDGILIGIPCGPDGQAQVVRRLAEEYVKLAAVIDHENESAPAGLDTVIGSRIAVSVGQYEYGKIGGVSFPVHGFDGSIVVETSRMESALAANLRGLDVAPRHAGIFSAELAGEVDELPSGSISGPVSLASKEWKGVGYLWDPADPAVK